jgi:hypothetical protein
MNQISPKGSNVSPGSLTQVKTTTEKLQRISDVMQHDSKLVVKSAAHFSSDVMQHDLQSIAKDASSLADMLRNPHLYN